MRLGLEAKREALPNRLEGKELVRQLKERMIIEAPDQQSFKFKENGNPFWFPTDPLISIIKVLRPTSHFLSVSCAATRFQPDSLPANISI